nr:cupin domain-containing protein [Sphingomonas sp. Y57]
MRDSDEAIGRDLAQRIVEIREERGLSLRKLAAMSGIPLSTLSKVQNNLTTLTYPHLVRLAAALGLELSQLFSKPEADVRAGRRAVTFKGQGLREATTRYRFELLCADLAAKKMSPGIMEITARTLEEAGGLDNHEGEEFIFVLSGEVTVITEDYRPTPLREGDSMYLDSSAGHAYVATGDGPARVLAVTTHMIRDLQHL